MGAKQLSAAGSTPRRRPRTHNTGAKLAQGAGEKPNQETRKRVGAGSLGVLGSSTLAVWHTAQNGQRPTRFRGLGVLVLALAVGSVVADLTAGRAGCAPISPPWHRTSLHGLLQASMGPMDHLTSYNDHLSVRRFVTRMLAAFPMVDSAERFLHSSRLWVMEAVAQVIPGERQRPRAPVSAADVRECTATAWKASCVRGLAVRKGRGGRKNTSKQDVRTSGVRGG